MLELINGIAAACVLVTGCCSMLLLALWILDHTFTKVLRYRGAFIPMMEYMLARKNLQWQLFTLRARIQEVVVDLVAKQNFAKHSCEVRHEHAYQEAAERLQKALR